MTLKIAQLWSRCTSIARFSTGIGGGVDASGASAAGPSADQQMRMTKFVKRLVWYPIVLITAWTFATINRIQNAVDPDNPIFGLFLLHVSCSPSTNSSRVSCLAHGGR